MNDMFSASLVAFALNVLYLLNECVDFIQLRPIVQPIGLAPLRSYSSSYARTRRFSFSLSHFWPLSSDENHCLFKISRVPKNASD